MHGQMRRRLLERHEYATDPAKDPAGSVAGRLAEGLTIGVGKSTGLGWFKVVGFDPEKKTADSSHLVVSCSTDERDHIFRQRLEHIQCRAADNKNDTIHTVIRIIPRPT